MTPHHAILMTFLLGCLAGVASAAAPEIERGLVGYWSFDEIIDGKCRDGCGSGSEAVLLNAPQPTQGVSGQALSFVGKEDKVEVLHSPRIDLGSQGQSTSVSFWFRSVVLPKDPPDAHFITKFGDPYPFSFVQVSNGFVQMRTYDSKVCSTIDSGSDISDGGWHYVVGMRDGVNRRLSLHVDGALVSTGADEAQGDLNNSGPLWIGRSHGADFSGDIDEVRIYDRLLSRDEVSGEFHRLEGHALERIPCPPGFPAKRALGKPGMRQRLEGWHPTVATDGSAKCRREKDRVFLKNGWMDVVVSTKTGEITSLVCRGKSLLNAPAGVCIKDVVAGVEFRQDQGKILDVSVVDDKANPISLQIRKAYGQDYEATITYWIGGQDLCWDVQLSTRHERPRESRIEFNVPALSKMTQAFWARQGAPFDLSSAFLERITYRQWDFRTAMILPSVTVYNPSEDVGLSIVMPFDLPKPGPYFELDGQERRIGVHNPYLRLAQGETARAALHLVPHEGCWRPGLAWMLRTYPQYFRPGTQDGIETPGGYWLGGPFEEIEFLDSLRAAGCKWFQIHGHFPFYGMYLPEGPSWEVVLGLADQGKASLEDWETGKAQGGPTNSFDHMRKAIDLRQQRGMQSFLYFQSFELWAPYAQKHFPEEIARSRSGAPLGAWAHCNLMNPDPAFPWGQNIASQIQRVPREYPALDGLFYDRDDYRDYDYAHDDGVTMIGESPCYMLGFAQEQINETVTGVMKEHGMGIWTNGPTSVEVCKGIDGIMSEAAPQAYCHQYLGLARPMVLLPYFLDTQSYDTTPEDTEEKLKVALMAGFFPSLTYGGPACKALDEAFRPLFQLLKGREWVLSPHALELDEGLDGNIFRSPEGHYVITVVDFDKSQVRGDLPSQSVSVRIRVPDAQTLECGYVLAGDHGGVGALEMIKEGAEVKVVLPAHLACSAVVLSRTPLFSSVLTPRHLVPPLASRGAGTAPGTFTMNSVTGPKRCSSQSRSTPMTYRPAGH